MLQDLRILNLFFQNGNPLLRISTGIAELKQAACEFVVKIQELPIQFHHFFSLAPHRHLPLLVLLEPLGDVIVFPLKTSELAAEIDKVYAGLFVAEGADDDILDEIGIYLCAQKNVLKAARNVLILGRFHDAKPGEFFSRCPLVPVNDVPVFLVFIHDTRHGRAVQTPADYGRIGRHLPMVVDEPFLPEGGPDKTEDTMGVRAENQHCEGPELALDLIGDVGIGPRKVELVKGTLLTADAKVRLVPSVEKQDGP